MSYNDLILEEGIQANFLAVLNPRRILTSWSLHSGSVYFKSFTLGFVNLVEQDGVALTQGSSTSLSAGQFYYDSDSQTIYIRTITSAAPSGFTIVGTYEIYVGTFDAHWNRDPLDDTTQVVYYEPLIANAPSIQSSVSDLYFGVLPTRSSSITLNNAEKILNPHLYYSSFNKAEIKIYHWLGDLETQNLKLVYRGRMNNHSWDDSQLKISIYDAVDAFDTEFRVDQTKQFYSKSDYAELDDSFDGSPIRYVYGIVNGFVPVNIDYKVDEATTSDNRVWAIVGEGSTMYEKTATVPSSPSSTTTRTYVDSAQGFSVGDTVRLDKTTDESRTILAVDYVSNYIEHSALSSGAAANGNTVRRAPVGRVEIRAADQTFLPQLVRDFNTSVDANGVLLMTLTSSAESNLGMAEIIDSSASISCRVYGKQRDVTLDGVSIGSNDASGGNLQNAAVILVDVLKRYADIPESDLNIDDFEQLVVDAPDRIGFAIPMDSGSKPTKIKQIVTDICSTTLSSFYQDEDLKWSAKRLSDIGSVSGEITDDEILEGSIEYEFDYSDMASDVVVKYASRESSENGIGEGYKLKRSGSTNAMYLHKVKNTMEVDSLHYNDDDAQQLADRLVALYGERQGVLDLQTKNRFFEFTIDQILRVTRPSLPGFEYDEETDRSIDFNARATTKGLRRVTLTVNDLKGVTDNSGEF